MKPTPIMAVILILSVAVAAFAGHNPNTKVAVHVRPHNAQLGCDYGTIVTCDDLNVTEPGNTVDAFPVFFDVNEFLGCEYGMWWPDWTYSAAFVNCADMAIGEIAWPGDGASHTWEDCQTGLWVCVPSYIWLYADGPGIVCVIPHPVGGAISLQDCAEGLDEPFATFCAGVYGLIGDDPCPPVGTSQDRWGAIKGTFE
jgi:hypothetical protein